LGVEREVKMDKNLTLLEFKRSMYKSGESTIGAAFIAQRVIDDDELREKAKELLRLEDEFEELLNARSISR
jgi:hypothetical protein